jgi:hypothetical protein
MYEDYGPAQRMSRSARVLLPTARWIARPHCDMCGPFRGRYLRKTHSGEYRCRGCDEE